MTRCGITAQHVMHDGAHRVNSDNCARNLRQRPAVRATTMHDRRSLGHRHAVHSGAHALKGVSRQSGAPQGPRNARPATICNNAPTLTASHQNPTAGSVTAGPRYHAFDAIRGAAMSLGVVLHGAVAYMAVPLPGLVWPVHDQATSPVIDGAAGSSGASGSAGAAGASSAPSSSPHPTTRPTPTVIETNSFMDLGMTPRYCISPKISLPRN